jgi:glycosyltransferase involved in cell wall biosynthesis
MAATPEQNVPDATPLVSMLIPLFNQAPFVERAIASALAQTHRDLEILVLDDGSTDASYETAADFARRDPRIRLERVARNEGVAAARNRLLARARGKYTCFLDGDDFILPEKIASQIAFLDAHPEFCAVGTGCLLVDDEDRTLRRVRYSRDDAELRYFPDFCCASVMYRAEVLQQAGTFRTGLANGEDVELVLRISEFGRVTNLPDALYAYRRHKGQLSRRAGSGHIVAVAFKLYRCLGRADVIEGRDLSEAEIFRRVLQDADSLLGCDGAHGADLSRAARPAVVLVLLHAVRRAGRWRDVVRILSLCATRTPRALIRVMRMWIAAAHLNARIARRSHHE